MAVINSVPLAAILSRTWSRLCRFGCISLLVVSFLLPAFSVQAAVIRLAADSWCPYSCLPENDRPGYVVELADKIFAKAGIKIDYQVLNWSRSILMARQGKIIGIIGATVEEAPDFIFPDEPVGISVNTFWTGADSTWQYAGPQSLDKLQVGVIQDYDYGDELNEYLKTNRNNNINWVHGRTASEKNIKRLAAGWLDVIIEDEAVFLFQAGKLNKRSGFRLADSEVPCSDDYIYIAFSPSEAKAEEYAALLSEGIRNMRASGELAALLARYNLTDWKTSTTAGE